MPRTWAASGHGAAHVAEHRFDVPAFGVGQAQARVGPRVRAGQGGPRAGAEVGRLEHGLVAQEHGALEHVAELAHVAGPGGAAQGLFGLGRKPHPGPPHLRGDALDELPREQQDVLAAARAAAGPRGGWR